MNEYTKNPGEQDAAQAVSETPETAQCGCGAEVCPGCGGQDAPACPGCGACAQPDEDIAQEAVALAADAPAEEFIRGCGAANLEDAYIRRLHPHA